MSKQNNINHNLHIFDSILLIIPLSKRQQYWLEFSYSMTAKEIKSRYKQAVFGFAWVILNPLLQMLIMGFVFQFFIPVKVDNYFLFLFTGLLPWMFFSLSLSKATPAIFHERLLVKKAKFPRESIVLSIILSNLFHFAISLGLLVILLVGDKVFFEGYSALEIARYFLRLTLVVPITIWLGILTSGLSLLTSALNVRFRDINFMVQALLPLWFYGTPIVYTLKLLPENLHFLFYLNPVTAIIEAFHWALLNLPPARLDLWLISFTLSCLALYMGWWVFSEENKWFDDWL